jgi:membrane protease YdiL (CAAX protease family)
MIIVLGAVGAGIGVLLAGSLPWSAFLAPLNLRVLTIVPWAVVPMAAYLWMYWKYIAGAIGSPDTAAWRHECLRANRVRGDVWAMALFTGVIGFAALLSFVAVMGRLTALPASTPITAPAGMPTVTVFVLLLMGSVVAGVTEEAGFRGYMQGPIERRFGLAVAILVNGVAFGVLHFPNHPAHVLTMLPYYIAVSAVYGGITSAANSILPALVLHAGGDVWSLTRLWVTGTPEWQIAAEPQRLVWDTGVDGSFLLGIAALVVFAAFATWLGVETARLARAEIASTSRRLGGQADA